MAKGKAAAHAANQRYKAALEHIDKLTEQLADAKLRARLVEDDAARVPHLLDTVERLQRIVDGETAERVAEMQGRHETERAELVTQRDAAVGLLARLLGRLNDASDKGLIPADVRFYSENDFRMITENRFMAPVRDALSVDRSRRFRRTNESKRFVGENRRLRDDYPPRRRALDHRPKAPPESGALMLP